MNKKADYTEMFDRAEQAAPDDEPQPESKRRARTRKRAAPPSRDLGINTPRGQRDLFKTVAFRLPTALVQALEAEVSRQRNTVITDDQGRRRYPTDISMSSIARVALSEYLNKDES